MLSATSIGNKIADARKKKNLTQSALAQQVSISPQAVGKWERGESMPDLATLNRLAEILGVDLNYFSESFSASSEMKTEAEITSPQNNTSGKRNPEWNWDMSQGNWTDADFSGLKNLKEKFSSSNMKNCKFTGSDLSGLILGRNNIELCDFTSSDLRNCNIHSSNLDVNQFVECSFIDAALRQCNIGKCDFSLANFSGAEFYEVNFEKNIINDAQWKFTAFKRSNLSDITFEGTMADCHFEHCSFYNVTFQNATILHSFFKYNKRFKKVKFIDCKVDQLTYAFLKSNQANLSGISIIS